MAGISGRTLVGPFKGRKKRKRRSQVLSTLFFAAVFLCLLFFLLGLGYANAAPTNTNTNNSPPGLFGRPAMMLDSSASGSGGEVTNNPVAAQSALVSVDTSLLGAKGPGAIALNMFGKTLVAQRHSVKVTGNNRTEWVGTIQGQQLSSVVLIADQGKLAGSVKTVDEAYEVDVKGRGMSALVELDWRSFPPEAHPKEGEHNDVAKGSTGSLLLKRKSKSLERRRQIVPDPRSSEPAPPAAFFESRYPPPRPSKHKRQSPSSPDATSTYEVHVMVLYTTAARIASGGTSAMLTKIDLAISLANQAYLNSNVSQTLKLVYAQEVWDYDEQGMSADLNRLVDPSDGYMDDIHALRDLYAADLVSLFIEDMTYCGIAYLMRNPSTTFAPLGFSVVNYWCATGAYTFAHELGHNMGCAHDRANSAVNDGAYDYSFGYQEPSAKWRTIMGGLIRPRLASFRISVGLTSFRFSSKPHSVQLRSYQLPSYPLFLKPKHHLQRRRPRNRRNQRVQLGRQRENAQLECAIRRRVPRRLDLYPDHIHANNDNEQNNDVAVHIDLANHLHEFHANHGHPGPPQTLHARWSLDPRQIIGHQHNGGSYHRNQRVFYRRPRYRALLFGRFDDQPYPAF